MKSKKSLYILIPSVILVWALIIYKIFSFTRSPEINNKQFVHIDTPSIISKDTIKIPFIAKYRDPFLSRTGKSSQAFTNKRTTQPVRVNKFYSQQKKKNTKPVFINWPKIDYNGMIYSQETNEKLALINLNRKNHLMQINQVISGCELIGIYQDSIVIKYKDEKKTFNK